MKFDIKSTIALSNGIEMPRFGLGVWQVEDEKVLRNSVKAALDCGYTHIDTAAIYQNEDMVGRAVEDFTDRKKLFITTKLWNEDHNDAEKAFELSLKKLRTDYIDLYLIHWPSPKKGNYVQAWKSLVDIYKSGRAKAIGVSNFKPAHIEKIVDATGVMPMANQVERHPLFQQDELAAYCRQNGIVTVGYSPLASGRMGEFAAKIEPIAQKHGKSVAQVVLRWHLQTDWVLIPKSANPSRVAENADIFNFSLDEDDLRAIKNIGESRKLLADADEANF
jgi:diketogulonate reductase-like aldo/keto reductase